MKTSVFLVGALLFGALAQAAPLTYDVNVTVGTGQVTGTITTDGVQGAVAQTDVEDWNFLLSDPTLGLSIGLNTANSLMFWGTGVTATPSALTFDFDTAYNGFTFESGGATPGGEWWLNSPLPNNFIPSREHIDWWGPNGYAFTGIDEIDGVTGTLTFATAEVPEPSALTLFAAGLALVGFATRRQLAARRRVTVR